MDLKSDFPSNSNNEPSEEVQKPENIKKVITGTATVRKGGLGRKILETFKGEDADSVGRYILFDVALPALKDLISDMVKGGVDRALYGSGAPLRSSSSTTRTHTSYSKIGDSKKSGRALNRRDRASHNFKEIIVDTRREGEAVIEKLQLIIEEYNVASVADFYELVDITGSFQDNKWGWSDIKSARVSHIREGYLIEMPQPDPLD